MKTVDIKGKQYVMVNERIKNFRDNNTGQIVTELVSNENGVCIFKAEILVDGVVVATGHAYEKEGSTFINKTSYIENCETSAIGRALGIFGIGIDASIASAEEVGNAVKQQKKVPESSFLKKMKGWCVNEPEIYWGIMKKWQMEKAADIKNPEAQKGILQEMTDVLDGEQPL